MTGSERSLIRRRRDVEKRFRNFVAGPEACVNADAMPVPYDHPMVGRLASAISPDSTVDVTEHLRSVARMVVTAKARRKARLA